jgi:parallel beta-helix repeat protein
MISGTALSERPVTFQEESGPVGIGTVGSGVPVESQIPDYWPTNGWRRSSPEMQGMSSAKLNDMMQYVRQQSIGIDSVVVVRNGYVVFEEYPRPRLYGPESLHPLYSVTKSFSSALIGIAIKQGFIDGVQHKMLDFFPNRTFANVDSLKEAITLEHVLTMTSGLPWDEWTYPYGDSRNDVRRIMTNPDPVQFVLDRPMSSTPGTTWVYNSGGSHLLSAIINETTGADIEAFARENLFDPLGISNLFWGKDPFQRLSWGSMGLSLTPLDMAKFGFLYLNNGTWEGQQIIPAEWVTESTRPHFSLDQSWQYGYQWWISPAYNVYVARGYMGQNIIVSPDYNMVVVFTGSYTYGQEGTQLFYDYILPAVGSTVPDDYPTIQEAINHAAVGDVILVKPGTYYERVVVNKTISLVGEDVSTTIIDGGNTGHVISIVSDNVTLTGFTVQRGGGIMFPNYDAGISLKNTRGCKITSNNIVDNGCFGIHLLESNQNTVSGNDLARNTWYAIDLATSSGNIVSSNTAMFNGNIGIGLHYSSQNNFILGNTILNNTYGLDAARASNNTILGNHLANNSETGIWIQDYAINNTIVGNNVTDSCYCIKIEEQADSNTVSGNILTYGQFGIQVLNAKYTDICNNTITHNYGGDMWDAGIRLDSAGFSRIHSNLISDNWRGILLYTNSPNVSIYNNNISANEFGVRVASGGSNNLNMTGNLVANNNGYGIGLTGLGSSSNYATISQNTITDNSDGIALGQNSNYNSILQNNISRNKRGISIEFSTQNTIYHSNIADNNQQVNSTSASTNAWDNGCEGNYWSNYNGTDSDNDGVGDTYLPWEGLDNYPLMNVYWNPCDTNHDLKVDKDDIDISTRAFGTRSRDDLWNGHADITGTAPLVPDGRVDMRDIGLVAKDFGKKF